MTSTISHRAGDRLTAHDLGLDDLRFHMEVVDDPDTHAVTAVDLVFNEPLQFHRDRLGARWESLADTDGYLTHAAADRMVEAVRYLLNMDELDIEHADHLEDEDAPSVALSVRLPVDPAASLAQVIDLAWPVIAGLTNITDPGTFNSGYLFTYI